MPSTVVWRQCYIQILNMAVPQSHSLYINQSSIMSGPKFFEWNSFDNCDDPHQKSFRRVHDIACLLDECMNCFLKARICQITPKDLSSKDDLSFYIVGKVIYPKYCKHLKKGAHQSQTKNGLVSGGRLVCTSSKNEILNKIVI